MVRLIRRKFNKELVTYVLMDDLTHEQLIALRDRFQEIMNEPCEVVEIESFEVEHVIVD